MSTATDSNLFDHLNDQPDERPLDQGQVLAIEAFRRRLSTTRFVTQELQRSSSSTS